MQNVQSIETYNAHTEKRNLIIRWSDWNKFSGFQSSHMK